MTAGGHRRTGPRPAALRVRFAPAAPSAAVLLLHGGRADALTPPPRLNLPDLRMAPVARAVHAAVSPALPGGLLVAHARYRHRGWNGSRADAARDAERALDELSALHPDLPTVLIGHSMGGRAALRAAGHPLVRAVIGLAPWCPAGEPVAQLTGRRVVLLHDPADTVTDARDTWRLVRRARAQGVACCGVTVPHGRHTMVRGARTWHRLTAAAVQGVLRPDTMPSTLAAALTSARGDGTADAVVPARDVDSS